MASSNANRPSPGKPRREKAQTANVQDPDNPWDLESAEALTRIYEQSEAEWREAHSARRPTRGPRQPAPAATVTGITALEGRLNEIAERLQHSISGIEAGKSSASLGRRIDELEMKLAAALEDVAQRLEPRSLSGVEAQIGGLATQLQHTRGQLERLDAIDQRLREFVERFDGNAVEGLIEAASSRAASRAIQGLPAPAAGIDPERLDAIERVLHEEIAERRRAEEMTSSVLRTVEESLTRILDRVDGMEPATLAPFLPGGRDGPRSATSADPLLYAYARGAHALGQAIPASLLDAADYLTSPRRTCAPVADASLTGDLTVTVGEVTQPKPVERPAPAVAPIDTAEAADPDLVSTREGKTRPFAPTSGRRSSLLLGLAMLILGGAGYMLVDYHLAQLQLPTALDPAAARHAVNASTQIRVIPVSVSRQTEPADTSGATSEGAAVADRAANLPEAIGVPGLRLAAARGDPIAQFEVASRFAQGRGVPQDDAQAFAWFQRSAMRGFAPAQFRLAGLFERGLGVTADGERAKVWYRRAAEQGHVKAMHNLAVLSAKKEAPDNYATAAKWFQQAADHGLADSQYNLAVLYQSGQGVTKSLPESYKWFALAARAGDKEAAQRLEHIKTQLAPAELAAADRQIENWHARPADIKQTTGLAAPIDDAAAGG